MTGSDRLTTGRPLDDGGDPVDAHALALDPDGPAADLLRDAPHPLVSSPGAGTWATLLASAAAAADDRPRLLQWLAPDAAVPPTHYHPRSETFRAVEGEFTVVVEGDPVRLSPGESVTVEAGQPHTFRNDTDGVVAFVADLSSARTVDGLFSIWGLDHEGAFADDGGYGEPGSLHALLLGEALAGDTTMTALPLVVQRTLWATVGRVVRARGHRAVKERYRSDEFWRRTVEQPSL